MHCAITSPFLPCPFRIDSAPSLSTARPACARERPSPSNAPPARRRPPPRRRLCRGFEHSGRHCGAVTRNPAARQRAGRRSHRLPAGRRSHRLPAPRLGCPVARQTARARRAARAAYAVRPIRHLQAHKPGRLVSSVIVTLGTTRTCCRQTARARRVRQTACAARVFCARATSRHTSLAGWSARQPQAAPDSVCALARARWRARAYSQAERAHACARAHESGFARARARARSWASQPHLHGPGRLHSVRGADD